MMLLTTFSTGQVYLSLMPIAIRSATESTAAFLLPDFLALLVGLLTLALLVLGLMGNLVARVVLRVEGAMMLFW